MKTERELFQDILDARDNVERIEKELEFAKEERLNVERVFIELMDSRDLKSLRIEGLGLITRKETLYVNVKKEDEIVLLSWIDEECGRPDLIKRTIHPSSLRSFITQRIKEGEPVPAYVNQYYKPGLVITRNS